MGNKINVSELLKDCPKGMELDCAMYDNAYFEQVDEKSVYPIVINIGNTNTISLTKEGHWNKFPNAKCVIFPKGKTTWEGFVPPCKFKDGDIVYLDFGHYYIITIFKKQYNDFLYCHALLRDDNTLSINTNYRIVCTSYLKEIRYATEEEKEELFNAINDNGYCWNDESKILEKLIKPKPKPCFKSGDTIRHKKNKAIIKTIGYLDKDNYVLYDGHILFFSEQDQYELIPNKFDISKLKPFDQVLVRDFDSEVWEIDFFSKLLDGKHFKCHGSSYVQCIPYKGNEHLHNTTNTCHPFYKTWEK